MLAKRADADIAALLMSRCAVRALNRSSHLFHRMIAAHIGAVGGDRDSRAAQFFRGFRESDRVDIDEGEMAFPRGELLREGAPKTTRRTRDHRDPALIAAQHT